MDSKQIVAALIGLVVGLAAGYVAWHQEKPAPPPTRGEWPMVPCPPTGPPQGTAAMACDQITQLAMAVQPATVDSQYCAVTAQSVKSRTPSDESVASQHVHNARLKAQAGDWTACRTELDMVED